ncbi:PRC-barrel domain containing protein [Halobacteriales archaeon Cl-PHB]
MTSRTTITSADEGKPVVVGDESVGRVVSVEGGTAYVAPDPGVTETVRAKLGWGEVQDEDFPLQERGVETITEDEVRLVESV